MEELYKYFSWGFIAIGGITGVGLLIRHLAQAKVNFYFNKELKTYKIHQTVGISRFKINSKIYL